MATAEVFDYAIADATTRRLERLSGGRLRVERVYSPYTARKLGVDPGRVGFVVLGGSEPDEDCVCIDPADGDVAVELLAECRRLSQLWSDAAEEIESRLA